MSDAMNYAYKVEVLSIHDGDTVTVSIDLGFYIEHTTPIRMAGINAPELNTDAGKAAHSALVGFVSSHPGQWTANTYKSGEEKYGRWLADLFAPDGTNVNLWMLDNGYAVVDNG